MSDKCPGRRAATNLDAVIVECPDCGRKVEFFTDEPKRHCKCGKLLLQDSLPRCADWCPAAPQCFGDIIDSEKLKRHLDKIKNDSRAAECVARIRDLLKKKEEREKKEGSA